MKIRLTAVLGLKSQGADKAEKETRKLKNNIRDAEQSAARMNKSLSRTRTGQSAMEAAGFNRSQYRSDRSVVGGRGATGKNFSGMAAGLGGGGGSLVGAYAQLAANVFALSAAFQALSSAARVQQLTEGLELMGARGGIALKQVAQGLRETTDNAISTQDAMRSVAQASSAGFGADEIERLGKVARGASLALGRDTGEALDRLTRGVIKLEPELLDELGIMTRLDQAVKEYALANKKAVTDLTQTERRQAFLNAALDEGERKFGAISEQISANPYNKLSAAVQDLAVNVGNLVNKYLIPLITLFVENPFLLILPGVFLASKALQGLGIASGIAAQTFEKSMTNVVGSASRSAVIISDRMGGTVKSIRGFALAGGKAILAARGMEKASVAASVGFNILKLGAVKAGLALRAMAGAMLSLVATIAPMLIITAIFAVGGKLVKGFQASRDASRGLTEEVKKSISALSELGETAEKVREQMSFLTESESYDAALNSIKAFRAEVEKLLLAFEGTAVDPTGGLATSRELLGTFAAPRARGRAGTREVGLATALEAKGVEEEIALAIEQQLTTIEAKFAGQGKSIAAALLEQDTQKNILAKLLEQLGTYDKLTGRFSEINKLSTEFNRNMTELAGKDFQTNLTKPLAQAQGILAEATEMNLAGNLAFTTEQRDVVEEIAQLLGQTLDFDEAIDIAQLGTLVNTLKTAETERVRLLIAKKNSAELAKQQSLTAKIARENVKINEERRKASLQVLSLAGARGLDPFQSALQEISVKKQLLPILRQETQARIQAIKDTRDFEIQQIQDQINARGDLSDQTTKANIARQDALREAARLEIEAENQRVSAAEATIANLNTTLNAYNDTNVVEKRRLDNLKQEIGFLKQRNQLTDRFVASSQALAKLQVAVAAATQGRAVTPEENIMLERGLIEDKITALGREETMREKEHELALAQLALEKKLSEAQFAILRGQTTDPATLALIDTMESDSNAIFDNIRNLMGENMQIARDELAIRKEILNLERDRAKRSATTRALEGAMVALSGARQGLGNALGSAGIPSQGREFFLNAVQQGGGIEAFSDEELKNLRQMSFEMARLNIVTEGTVALFDTMQSSLEEAFMSMIDGSKSAGEAFKDMAKAILTQIAQIIVKLLVVKALQAIGLPIPGAGGGIIGTEPGAGGGMIKKYANGGIVGPRDGLAGVVSRPTYLVGEGRMNEAVVPLPNGRAIPVQMHGGGDSQQNNVTVNVNVEGGQTSSEGNGERAQKLGQMVSSAVQKELMAQKQPGGLLSKYG